jgi:hypothetical protein
MLARCRHPTTNLEAKQAHGPGIQGNRRWRGHLWGRTLDAHRDLRQGP